MNKKMLSLKNKYKTRNICASGDFTELEKIRDFVAAEASSFGFSGEDSQRIALAVDEACTNLINHAFKRDSNRKICIEIEPAKNQFIVNILDDGIPFNPLEVPQPDMQEYFKSYKRGGLGIQIMRLVMDEISYIPQSDSIKKNVLKLKKVLQ